MLRYLITGCVAYCISISAYANTPFSFGVVRNAFQPDARDVLLLRSLTQMDSLPLSFLVVNGIKHASEPCSDQLYSERLAVLQLARQPTILSLTGNDWTTCMGSDMHDSIANERLQHIRDLFYNSPAPLNDAAFRLMQESVNPEFRAYAENNQWEQQDVLFATLNVPGPNNHFVMRGGHNSEYEDRQVANTEWLKRLFIIAHAKKSKGIVIFTDADIVTPPERSLFSLREKPDGMQLLRKTLTTFSHQFSGKVLLISNASSAASKQSGIVWHKNLGHIATNASWMMIDVHAEGHGLFSIKKEGYVPLNNIPSPAYHEDPTVFPVKPPSSQYRLSLPTIIRDGKS